MKSFLWRTFSVLALVIAADCVPAMAQASVLSCVVAQAKVVKPGEIADVRVACKLARGYHVNSNQPTDPFLIPLKLTIKPGVLVAVEVSYPKPHLEKLNFSADEISVFSGEFEIAIRGKVLPTAGGGPSAVEASLRYQACTDGSCLPPKTIDIRIPLQVR